MWSELVSGFNTYMLVAARVSGVLLTLPVFSARFIPVLWRVGLCLSLSAILLPTVAPGASVPESGMLPGILFEVTSGLLVGLALLMVFAAVQVAGQMIDVQMGFGIVNVMDPQWEQPVPLVGNLLNLFTIMLFLVTSGHHQVIRTLAWSFSIVPPGAPLVSGAAVDGLVSLSAWMLGTAIRLSAPVVGSLLMVNLALGILGRTMPQMNLLVIGFPIKILTGFLLFLVVIPIYGPAIVRLLEWILGVVPGLWEVMRP